MEKIALQAPAKINLGLDVIGKRQNGYHDVKMIMQTLHLCDEIVIEKTEALEIMIATENDEIPIGEDNLMYKAAALMYERFPDMQGVLITLKKNIPVAAGMGGGSADAAAVLVGMKHLFDLDITLEELKEIGLKIGADVPFCMEGGTVLAEGIGEVLTKIATPPDCYVAVAKPDLFVSTKYVYENLRLGEIKQHLDIDGMLTMLEAKDLQGICDKMENVLESVTMKEYPIIQTIRDRMKCGGAMQAMMSGSGPTVFGIFAGEEMAREVCNAIYADGLAKQVFVTTFREAREIMT